MTDTRGSVSRALEGLRTGDRESAAEVIYLHYFERLLRAADARGSQLRPGATDSDVAASSALRSVMAHLEAGRLPGLRDREGLLKFLLYKVEMKAIQAYRREATQRRGGLVTRGEGEVADPEQGVTFENLMVDRQPSAEEVAEWASVMARLRTRLSDEQMRAIELDLEGFTQREIADRIGVSVRSIYSYRQLAREIVAELLGD